MVAGRSLTGKLVDHVAGVLATKVEENLLAKHREMLRCSLVHDRAADRVILVAKRPLWKHDPSLEEVVGKDSRSALNQRLAELGHDPAKDLDYVYVAPLAAYGPGPVHFDVTLETGEKARWTIAR
jgi:hypothetical protein